MRYFFSRNWWSCSWVGAFLAFSGLAALQHGAPDTWGAAHAAGGVVESPTGTAPDRYVYYPGTEELSPGEVRVIACGTGMPDQRRGQASACFLFEFGNGEKLIFDIGTGSMRNINALMIPSEFLTKVFLSHLHTDHWGDLDGLWAGGWTSGRPVPLEIWGPSGREPEMGTAYAVDGFMRAYNWDFQTRSYKITPVPGGITVNEFDYKAENAVIYDDGEIVVRTIPAIHTGDGPVSFIIEYAGLKLVYGGDTAPNKWFVEYAKDADFVIHEAFASPDFFLKDYGQPAQLAWRACCEFHTSGPSFGKIMSEVQPGHAVAYHSMEESHPELLLGIRSTYDGPLSVATDMMTWNITAEGVTERMAVSPDRASAVPGPSRQPPPDPDWPDPMSQFLKDGEWGPGFNAQNDMLDEFRDENDLGDVDWRLAKPWYEPN